MSDLVLAKPTLPAMSEEALDRIRKLEEIVLAQPQLHVTTDHLFHAGMYARTIRIPAGVVLTSALIKIPTVVVVNGDVVVSTDDDHLHLTGYHIVPASVGRKQAYLAYQDTDVTMVFPTRAKSVDEAEREFTDEFERLASHVGTNNITITGE